MAEKREILLDIQVRAKDAQKQLAEVQKRLTQNSESQKELNRQLKAGEISLDAYAEATTAVKLDSAELRKEQRSLTRQIQNSTKATDAAEGSNEQLRAQLSLLTAEYNSLSKEQRENTERGKELQLQTREISDALKENEGAVGDNRRNVGNYQSALDGLGGALDKVIPGFSNFTSALGKTAGEGEKSGSVLTRLGKTGGKLGGIAGKLGKALGGPLVAALIALAGAGVKAAQAIVDITREFDPLLIKVNQLTGATGNFAASITGQVSAISKTFGQDFNETLTAANTVANAFGISINEALDQIQAGFVNGADASGQYLSVLQEYPAQLASVGLSFEEANALILQQTQEGIFSDKGIDAIKEAGIRLRELTPATREALEGIGLAADEVEAGLRDGSVELFDVIQQVGGKLGELEANSPEVGAALADIFGGPGEDAGIEYIKLLGDIDGDLGKVSRAADDVTDRLNDQVQATEDLDTAKANLADTFAPVVNFFDIFGKQVLTFVIEQFNNLITFFTVFLPAAFDGFLAEIQNIPTVVKSTIDGLLLDLKIAAKEVENFFSFSDTVERELQSLKGQREELAKTGADFGDAFSEAYNESVIANRAIQQGFAAQTNQREREQARVQGAAVGKIRAEAESEAKQQTEAELEKEEIEKRKAMIENLIAEEELGLLRIEQNTLASEDRKIEARLQREKRLIELRAQLALTGLDEESAQYKLITERTLSEITQLYLNAGQAQAAISDDTTNAIISDLSAVTAAAQQNADAQRQAVEESEAAKRAAAEQTLRFQELTEEDKLQIIANAAGTVAQIAGEESTVAKAAAIAQATINTYLAASKALATVPPPFGQILAGVAIAQGLAQVANIAGVQTSFQDGGLIEGPRHAQGGVPFAVGGAVGFEAEGGEFILNRGATRMFLPQIVAMNEMGKRANFETGGFVAGAQAATLDVSSRFQQATQTGSDIMNAIANLPSPVVTVRDINTVQDRVKVKENLGNL